MRLNKTQTNMLPQVTNKINRWKFLIFSFFLLTVNMKKVPFQATLCKVMVTITGGATGNTGDFLSFLFFSRLDLMISSHATFTVKHPSSSAGGSSLWVARCWHDAGNLQRSPAPSHSQYQGRCNGNYQELTLSKTPAPLYFSLIQLTHTHNPWLLFR